MRSDCFVSIFLSSIETETPHSVEGLRPEIRNIPGAHVSHKHGGTAGVDSIISVYTGKRNLFRSLVKNFPVRAVLTMYP